MAADLGDEGAEEEEAATVWDGKKKSGRARTAPALMLCLHLADGTTQETQVDLSAMKSMKEVQATVLQEWMQAGGDRRESLMMEHEDAGGETIKVTKTTDLVALKAATVLNLLPKRWKARRDGSTYGQLHQEEAPLAAAAGLD